MDGVSSLAPELQQAFARASQAERKPLAAMETRKAKMEERGKLLTDVIGKVEGAKQLLRPLSSAAAIRELVALSSDDKAVTGFADKTLALPGKHMFEIGRLASPASAVSNGFADSDQTRVGTGYLRFERANGDTEEVYIDNDHATLSGIAQSINSASLGVQATVINDQSNPELPFRLLISTNSTGVANGISYPEFYFVDGEEDLYIDQEHPATNALIKFQGFEYEVPNNEIRDLIPGLSLSLKGITNPGRPAYITIEQDTKKTAVKLKELVDKLNEVFSFIQQQNKIDENTKTDRTLGGDYGIRLTESRLRNTLTALTSFGGPFRSASDVGVQFTKEGTLTLDEKKFEAVLTSDYEGVVDFLCGDGMSTGLVTRLNKTLGTIAGPGESLLSNQQKGQSDAIRRVTLEITDKEKAIQSKEESLKLKLARASAALESLKNQGSLFGQSQGPGPLG